MISTPPAYDDGSTALYKGDALELLAQIDDASVDLIATDPPYHKAIDEDWDREFDTLGEFCAWIGALGEQWRRIIKPNGSLYVFASPYNARHVENVLDRRFRLFPRIVWHKPYNRHQKASKEALRAYFPATEAIIFAETKEQTRSHRQREHGLAASVFEPIRLYLEAERKRAGYTLRQIDEHLGTNGMAGHYFRPSQWSLPTREAYEKLRELFNRTPTEAKTLRRDYEELRREFEELRRPFRVTAQDQYTDVWEFPAPDLARGRRLHPTQKPLALMRHIVKASSRPGDLVLDCFAGSGTTLVAARQLGRRSIGIERDEVYVERAGKRLAQLDLLAPCAQTRTDSPAPPAYSDHGGEIGARR